jgi:hypothetical protein
MIENLLGQMTLEEKVAMCHANSPFGLSLKEMSVMGGVMEDGERVTDQSCSCIP